MLTSILDFSRNSGLFYWTKCCVVISSDSNRKMQKLTLGMPLILQWWCVYIRGIIVKVFTCKKLDYVSSSSNFRFRWCLLHTPSIYHVFFPISILQHSHRLAIDDAMFSSFIYEHENLNPCGWNHPTATHQRYNSFHPKIIMWSIQYIKDLTLPKLLGVCYS